MADKSGSRNVNAREAVELINGPMTNAQLMETLRISPQGFADLLKKLFEKKLIHEEDLSRRGIRFKVVKPPSELAQTTIIPPPPVPQDEEFLDTVTLTELLSFKPTATPASQEPKEITPPEETKPAGEERKGKFSLTGLFKKAK
jgi:hypothetical protein